MKYNDMTLNRIYDKTRGYCNICGMKLSFRNYGVLKGKSSWEVDHSCPSSKNGTNHLNNFYATCIYCNRAKGSMSTTAARLRLNRTDAIQENDSDILMFSAMCGLLGFAIGRWKGALGVATIGAISMALLEDE